MSIDKVKPQSTPATSSNNPDNIPSGSGLVGPAALAGAGVGSSGGYFLWKTKMNTQDIIRKFGPQREDLFKLNPKNNPTPHAGEAINSIECLENYPLEVVEGIKNNGIMPHSFIDSIKDFEHLKPEEQAAAIHIQELLRYKNKHIDELDRRIAKVFGLDQNSKTLLQFYRRFIFKQLGKQVSLGFIIGEIGAVIASFVFHVPFLSKLLMFASPAIFSISKGMLMGDAQKAMGELYQQAIQAEGAAKNALDAELKKPNNETKIYQTKLTYLKAKANATFYKTVCEDIGRAIAQQGHSIQNPARIKQEDIVKIILKAQMKMKEEIEKEIKGVMKELGKATPKMNSLRNTGIAAGAGAVLFGIVAALVPHKKTKPAEEKIKDTEVKDPQENEINESDINENKVKEDKKVKINKQKDSVANGTKIMQAVLTLIGTAGLGAVALSMLKKGAAKKVNKALQNSVEEFMKSIKGTNYTVSPERHEKTGKIKKIICHRVDCDIEHNFDENGQRISYIQRQKGKKGKEGKELARFNLDPQTGEKIHGTVYQHGFWNWCNRRLNIFNKHYGENNQIIVRIDKKANTETNIYLRDSEGESFHHSREVNTVTGERILKRYRFWWFTKTPKSVIKANEEGVITSRAKMTGHGESLRRKNEEEFNSRGERTTLSKFRKGEDGKETLGTKINYDPDSGQKKDKIKVNPRKWYFFGRKETSTQIVYKKPCKNKAFCREKEYITLDENLKPIGESRTTSSTIGAVLDVKEGIGKSWANPRNWGWFKSKKADPEKVIKSIN